MLTIFKANRTIFSNWILIFFLVLLGLSAALSDLFRAPTNTNLEFQRYTSLFSLEDFKSIKKISLKNSLGKFELERENFHWDLVYPRVLPAKMESIKQIFSSLQEIKIRKIYQKDPINISNFSLSPPLLSITFHKEKKEDNFSISFGLIDAITNSTYLTASDKKVIYHIDRLNFALEKLNFSDFIDSKIVSVPIDSISTIKIYQGKREKNKIILSLNNGKELWKGKNGTELDKKKVNAFLSRLLSLKSSMILDKVTDKLQKKLDKYLGNPLYTLEIEDKNSNTYKYTISSVIYSLPDLKIEKRQNFAILASNRIHPYILNKEHLPIFNKREKSLKKLPIKNLFY